MKREEVLAILDELIDVPVIECMEDQELVDGAKRAREFIASALDDAERYRWLRDSRACSMQVSFNDHHNIYMSVDDTLGDSQGYYDDISADERKRMVATDTIWTVHIYPNTPVGFNAYHAATLDTAIDTARAAAAGGEGVL